MYKKRKNGGGRSCRRSQQEHKPEEGEPTSLPILDSASSELQRKLAKRFFTDVQACKPT